jgi:hypothetical protein
VAPTLWVLLDRGPAHPAGPTRRLAAQLGIELVWLPRQWPERKARDQVRRERKRRGAANRPPETMDRLAQQAENWLLALSPPEARRQAGVLSNDFWLKPLL